MVKAKDRVTNTSLQCILLGLILMTCGCSTEHDLYPRYEPAWSEEPVRVDVSPYHDSTGEFHPDLHFSRNGKYVCVWWWPYATLRDYTREQGKFVVFDLAGNEISRAKSADGHLAGEFIGLFPQIAWRSEYSDFLKNAGGWGLSEDLKYGFRIVDPVALQDGIGELWQAELWRLKPEMQRLWRVPAPEKSRSLQGAYFLGSEGKGQIVLVYGAEEAYLVDQQTGEVVKKFTCGHIDTLDERRARNRKFRLGYHDGSAALGFATFGLSFCPSKRLLACGAFFDRRVRVISIDSPHKALFEANTDDHPARPWGGVWRVDRVQFAGHGKYLIAASKFAGRWTGRMIQPTDIFETTTWKRVWRENTVQISSVCISPDCGTMAFLRDLVLEIGPFVPDKETGVQ